MRILSALLLLPLLAACDPDCANFDRLDGTWSVLMTVSNAPSEGAEAAMTLSDAYPTEELFINGTSKWKINYQASSKGITVLMNDVLEPTDLPGEDLVFNQVEISGSLNQDEENCNVVNISIKDSYQASLTAYTGATLTESTHDFNFAARLIYYGDQLSGTFTYSDNFRGVDGDGAPFDGTLADAEGSFLGTLTPEG